MNGKKAKALRRIAKNSYGNEENTYTKSKAGVIELELHCKRATYQELKKHS